VDLGGGGWRDTPENYALLLKTAYKAAKKANPECKIAIAGLGGKIEYYERILQYLHKIKDFPSEQYFDIFDFHIGGEAEQYKRSVSGVSISTIKELLKKYNYQNVPIWITEMSTYSDKPDCIKKECKFQTETEHAESLLKRYIYSLAHGIGKVFWVTLIENHNYAGHPNGYYDNVGLINNPDNDGQSHKKLAYYTYKKMVEVLEGSDWQDIQTIKEEENDAYGLYLYRFIKDGKPIYVGWYDCFDEQRCSRMKINTKVEISTTAKEIKITEAVPKYNSGKEVKDYTNAFNTEIKTVQNGKAIINLREVPVFVEEK
jgi:DNA-binding transcriptional MerR regulator